MFGTGPITFPGRVLYLLPSFTVSMSCLSLYPIQACSKVGLKQREAIFTRVRN